MIQAVQTVFAQTPAGASLQATLPQPTTVGNMLSLYLRFSPLTGTPALADNFGNAYKRTGVTNIDNRTAVGFWTAPIQRGGANHTVTITSQGGPQSLEVGIVELTLLASPAEGGAPSTNDLLLSLLAQAHIQTALLQRLVAAERG